MSGRMTGIDLVRTMAITLVVLIGLSSFIDVPVISSFPVYAIDIGFGLFLFSSGFLLRTEYPKVEGKEGIGSFLKERVAKTYPIYWFALMFVFVATPSLVDRSSLLFCLTGCQMLAGGYVGPNIFWFMSLVIVCNMIYPVLTRFADGPLRFIGAAIVLILPFIALSYCTELINVAFFRFYPLFIAGIVMSDLKGHLAYFTSKNGMCILTASFLTFASALHFFGYAPNSTDTAIIDLAFTVCLMTMMTLSAGVLLFCIGERVRSEGTTANAMAKISSGSFAAYLVHLSILVLADQLLLEWGAGHAMAGLMMALAALLCLAIGYFLESASIRIERLVVKGRKVHRGYHERMSEQAVPRDL